MPKVVCDYCDYVGKGKVPSHQWADVKDHERREHQKEE